MGGWQTRCHSLASERAVRALRGMTTREGGSVSGDGPDQSGAHAWQRRNGQGQWQGYAPRLSSAPSPSAASAPRALTTSLRRERCIWLPFCKLPSNEVLLSQSSPTGL